MTSTTAPVSLQTLKNEAHQLKSEKSISLLQAYEVISKSHGFDNWHEAQTALSRQDQEFTKAIRNAIASVNVKASSFSEEKIAEMMEECEWYIQHGNSGSLIILPEVMDDVAYEFRKIISKNFDESLLFSIYDEYEETSEMPSSSFYQSHRMEYVPETFRHYHAGTFFISDEFSEYVHKREMEAERLAKLAKMSPAEIIEVQPYRVAVMPTDFVSGRGYRVHFVFKDYPYTVPTGSNHEEPWYWGMSMESAEEAVTQYNRETLGLSDKEADDILMSSMRASNILDKRKRLKRSTI